jgi:protoporphyrinogen oxidase
MTTNKKIAVLGAGPMGLAVAYELVKQGYAPQVFEADDRVGGMTATFDLGGLSIERYYHFHCISDKDFLTLLDELQLADKMNWVETKMGFYYQNQVLPWGNPIALLMFKGLSLIAKFRYGLHAFLSTKRNDWQPLDGMEASSWIKRWVGEEAYNVLWKKLFDYKFYHYANQLSAAWIWSRIRRIGRSRYNLFREKLGYLEGGSDTFLNAMKTFIENNSGQVHLSSPVEKVIIEKNTATGIQAKGIIYSFDIVISTVPLPYVAHLIPDLPESVVEQYRSLRNIAVVCVIVKLKQSLTDNFWLNVNDPEMDIPGLVEYSNLRPLTDKIVYVPFYMPAELDKFKDSNDSFANKVKTYLQRINPSLTNDDFIEIKVSRYRYAQPVCPPNFLASLPPYKSSVKGLWIADTSYYYPEDRGISESIGFGRKMAREAIA